MGQIEHSVDWRAGACTAIRDDVIRKHLADNVEGVLTHHVCGVAVNFGCVHAPCQTDEFASADLLADGRSGLVLAEHDRAGAIHGNLPKT